MHGGTQRQEKPFSAFMGGVMWLTLPAKTRPTGGSCPGVGDGVAANGSGRQCHKNNRRALKNKPMIPPVARQGKLGRRRAGDEPLRDLAH
jgi:hypothetical protein